MAQTAEAARSPAVGPARGEVRRLTTCTNGGPLFVDVQDGRIVRMTPISFDEADAPSWSISARGHIFSPPRKTTNSPYTVAYRSLVYSPRRILTPLKRVDFDPSGAPGSTGPGGRNARNRGTSGYEPISWGEALDIVAAEIKRVKRERGPGAILSTPSSHHMWGNIGYRHSTYFRFMNLVGFTYGEHNPDSWEGWHWGATHMWGQSHRLGLPEQYDLLEDALKQLRDGRLLVGRPRGHLWRHLRCVREHASPAVAQGSRGENDRYRSLLQPHRRAGRRQVDRSPPRAPTWPWPWRSPSCG